ncbi:MAG: Crp/Fnr family transcriptional regulator [Gammaproteobacteria bacterium]
MADQTWVLPPSDFLGNLPRVEREALLAVGHRRVFRKGDHVFRSGAPGQNVYVLQEGRAKIYKLSDSGKEVILWFCFSGEVFGLAEVSRGGQRGVFAQVCTDAQVLCVRRDEFNQFLQRYPATAMQVIDLLSCRMRVLGDILLNLATDDVPARVIKLILRLCARYGKPANGGFDLEIPLTHQEIADMVGTTRQTVTSILSGLKRRGVLDVERQCIHIQSAELLEHMIYAGESMPRGEAVHAW